MYVGIISEKIDRAVLAVGGAMAMILFGGLSAHNAFLAIDYNTIGLLVAMMIIVMVIQKTGLFQYIAVSVVHVSKANPFVLMILLGIITGILSALLDNVTTILLIVPVTLTIAKDLEINPIPVIIAQIFASNVGGTATLIGDPPNIMIGSKAGIDFMSFITNSAVIAIPLLVLTTVIFALLYRKSLTATPEVRARALAHNAKDYITDVPLLKKSLIVFAFVVLGFFTHSALHIESSIVAMTGAMVLLLISKVDVEHILKEVEWKTIFFFAGLFMLVGGLEHAGVIHALADKVLAATGGDIVLATIAILWVSAIASAFLDNIPFVATMIPLIMNMQDVGGMDVWPLWWALALGACLGGNGTIIGASANVVAAGMSDAAGYKITFVGYMKVAFPLMLLTIVICTGYMFIRYI